MSAEEFSMRKGYGDWDTQLLQMPLTEYPLYAMAPSTTPQKRKRGGWL